MLDLVHCTRHSPDVAKLPQVLLHAPIDLDKKKHAEACAFLLGRHRHLHGSTPSSPRTKSIAYLLTILATTVLTSTRCRYNKRNILITAKSCFSCGGTSTIGLLGIGSNRFYTGLGHVLHPAGEDERNPAQTSVQEAKNSPSHG